MVGAARAPAARAHLLLGPSRVARGTAARGGTLASGFNRKLAQLTFGPGLEEWPAWAPDGTQLAYAGEVDGFKQLVLRAVATGEERRLSHEPKDHIQPAWSPDGQRIAFVRAKTERGKLEPSDLRGWYFEGGDIWTLDLGLGRGEPRWWTTRSIRPTRPTAPGSRSTRSGRGRGGSGSPTASGHNPRQVTSDSSEAVVHTEPRWSPDGTRLAFRRIEKTRSQIVDRRPCLAGHDAG